MTEHGTGGRVAELARRIAAVEWGGPLSHTTSRGYLMKEYLRRAAWWAQTTGASGFPFPDLAAAVDPSVRADPAVVDQVSQVLHDQLQGEPVARAVRAALHFAALLDAGVALPEAPAEPFEPLLVLLERGGGFRTEGGGFIEVDTLGIRPGTVAENLRPEPIVTLDPSALDALDARA